MSLPSTLMWSRSASAFVPSSVTAFPFTVTRPSTINCSALRRDATPAAERIFCRRSSGTGLLGSRLGRVGCAAFARALFSRGLFGFSGFRRCALRLALFAFLIRRRGHFNQIGLHWPFRLSSAQTSDLLKLFQRREFLRFFRPNCTRNSFVVLYRMGLPI